MCCFRKTKFPNENQLTQEADWDRRSEEQQMVNKMLNMATTTNGTIRFNFLPSQYQASGGKNFSNISKLKINSFKKLISNKYRLLIYWERHGAVAI